MMGNMQNSGTIADENTMAAATEASGPLGQSEHPHPLQQRQQPPPPVPIDESTNPDAMALRAALSVLHVQRHQALRDMQNLEKLKERATQDPKAFTEALKSGQLSSRDQGASIITFDEYDDKSEADSQDEKAIKDEEDTHNARSSKRHSTRRISKAQQEEEREDAQDHKQGSARKQQRRGGRLSKSSPEPPSKQSRTATTKALSFPRLPAQQSVVRTPPINWAKYHIVGSVLDKLHESERRNPTDGVPHQSAQVDQLIHQQAGDATSTGPSEQDNLSMEKPAVAKQRSSSPPSGTSNTQPNAKASKKDEQAVSLSRTRVSGTNTAVVAAPYDPWKDELTVSTAKPGKSSEDEVTSKAREDVKTKGKGGRRSSGRVKKEIPDKARRETAVDEDDQMDVDESPAEVDSKKEEDKGEEVGEDEEEEEEEEETDEEGEEDEEDEEAEDEDDEVEDDDDDKDEGEEEEQAAPEPRNTRRRTSGNPSKDTPSKESTRGARGRGKARGGRAGRGSNTNAATVPSSGRGVSRRGGSGSAAASTRSSTAPITKSGSSPSARGRGGSARGSGRGSVGRGGASRGTTGRSRGRGRARGK